MAQTGNPLEFDYFRRKEPLPFQRGKSSSLDLDYFRRKEPLAELDFFAVATPIPVAASGSVSVTTIGPILGTTVPVAASASTSVTTGTFTSAMPLQFRLSPPNPSDLDYFRRGEPCGLIGGTPTREFSHFRRNEPAASLTVPAPAASASVSTTSAIVVVPAGFAMAVASVSSTTFVVSAATRTTTARSASVSYVGGFYPGLIMAPLMLMVPGLLMQGPEVVSDLTITAVGQFIAVGFILSEGVCEPHQLVGVS